MSKLQFRVLYRIFLFRIVDLELLAPQGDMTKLLGQFAALLLFTGMLFSATAMGFDSNRVPQEQLLVSAWQVEHLLIATTMLVVGLFAVLSWDSTFPDRLDVLTLAPLPVRPMTLFLAKIAATATALGIAIVTFNFFSGISIPLALAPPSTSVLDLIFSPARFRILGAFWLTMFSAGAFVFCSVLALQGIVAQLLPRRHFLRVSALLQMFAFCLFVCVYFLQPSLATPSALSAEENHAMLVWLPSYWCLGLFQSLNGSMHPSLEWLARRAYLSLALVGIATIFAYAFAYARTLRRIVEEPEIAPQSQRFNWSLPFGDSLTTAVVQFSLRALMRSRQHRVMLAFYLGVGFAITILFLRTPRARHELFAYDVQLIFSSLMMMCVFVIGMRVVFSMPLSVRANWIFQMTQVRATRDYLAASRRSLFVLGVAPVWLISAVLLLYLWPWTVAIRHLMALALWGFLLAYISLYHFQKIPFTCSYLPGKSFFHMAFLAGLGLLFLIAKVAAFERSAFENPSKFATLLSLLAAGVAVAAWRTVAAARSADAIVQFEETPEPAVLDLGLHA